MKSILHTFCFKMLGTKLYPVFTQDKGTFYPFLKKGGAGSIFDLSPKPSLGDGDKPRRGTTDIAVPL